MPFGAGATPAYKLEYLLSERPKSSSQEMKPQLLKISATVLLATAAMLASEPADAFRCGNKLVKDGMHEQQVLARCGEPASIRHLGYAVRAYDYGHRTRYGGLTVRRRPFSSHFATEVAITEYIYNFGPRKLMRRLIFEGSVLVSIETIGYGYIEKSR